MAIAAAAGTPQYSGTFTPEVWCGKLLIKFYSATVFAAISNTDYEGEIKNVGDKVIIRTTPTITIRDYNKNQSLTIERPESDPVELEIDEAKYFNFICDDIDAYQSDIKLMDDWSKDASEQMKISIDTGILADIYNDPTATYNRGASCGKISASFNMGTTAAARVITKDNILEALVDCGTILDEQNIPEDSRWVIIPAWFAGMIKKSDLKDASLTGDGTSVMRNGRLGMIDRFTLYSSNLLKTTVESGFTNYHVMAGQRHALSFAAQMTKMQTLTSESTFGTLVRGLNVYGYEVLKPDALVELYCRK